MSIETGPGAVVVFTDVDGRTKTLFQADTDEQLAGACATMLRQVHQSGWFVEPSPVVFVATHLEAEALTPEQVRALPDGIRDQIVAVRNRVQERRDSYVRRAEEFALVMSVVEADSLAAAVALRTEEGDHLATWVAARYGRHSYELFNLSPTQW